MKNRKTETCEIHENYAHEYFNINQESPHMLMAVQAIDGKKDKIAATVHSDGSSRVQTVGKENNIRFWKLLNSFYEKTKVPVILNTSFNVRGEPVVCTPNDAYRCFMRTEMDYLVINNYLLDKKNQTLKKIDFNEKFDLD